MTTTTKVIIVVAYTALVFALGRYTVPEKIKTEIKIVEVEKKEKKEETNVSKKKKTKKVIITKPDGSKETTIVTDEETDKNSKKDEKSDKTTDTAKTEEKTTGSNKTVVSVMAGVDLITGNMIYGGSVYKPVLGPVGIGIWGLSNTTCGANIGLSF